MQQAYADRPNGFGLTFPQYRLTTALRAEGGCTVGARGQALRLESNTPRPMLTRFEGQGLVRRRRDRTTGGW